MNAAHERVVETCCQFGSQRQLAGILTETAAAQHSRTCILVNAGLVPKFGPYRLYAQLARRLAVSGIRTLRFDLGDVGDSRQIHAGRTLEERTNLEIAAAVDLACEHDPADRAASIILGGLCSGAEDSFRYAESDPRVGAIVLIDPFSYRTRGWRWRHQLHRATRRSLRWLGMYEPIDVRGAALFSHLADDSAHLEYQQMQQGEATRILQTLLDRGVRIHFVYTGGVRESFNHAGQLRAMFRGIDFKDLVTLDHFPHIEHLQALQEERETLIESIQRRCEAFARYDPRATGLLAAPHTAGVTA